MRTISESKTPAVVVLAAALLAANFAWGLPAEPPGNEGEAAATAEDPWAGVKISDAYDELRCTYCWEYNELTAARCPSCGHEFPLPSAEYTYPPWVFVPGRGYYKEGTLLEPGKTRKGYWIAGIVLTASSLPAGILAGYYGGEVGGAVGLAALGVGVGLIIYGLVARTEPVYAFAGGERFEPYESEAYARTSADSEGVALKVEVTVLGF
jgi:hypothetical protein